MKSDVCLSSKSEMPVNYKKDPMAEYVNEAIGLFTNIPVIIMNNIVKLFAILFLEYCISLFLMKLKFVIIFLCFVN